MSAQGFSDAADPFTQLQAFVESGDIEALGSSIQELHPSDVADVLELLDEDHRIALLRALPPEVASEALAELEQEEMRAELLGALAPELGAELLQKLTDDDAADLLAELEPAERHPAERERLRAALPEEEAADIEGLLLYGEETAGGLMTTELVSIQDDLTAEEAISEVRRQGREVGPFYNVFVVDEENRLLGTVPLAGLVLSDPGEPVSGLVEPTVASVRPDLDQEEVGRIFARYNLVSLPVVDGRHHLLGRITFDDVIDVIEAEQTEDILRLAGVSEEEQIAGGWTDAVRSRLPWLSFNLITASISASVVLLFGSTIESFWYLAAIMPIVAGLGGNSGTQALAVTVRRLAISGGPLEPRLRVVEKEALVGVANGLVLGLLASLVVWVMVMVRSDVDPMLPWVVLAAMWGNIMMASFAGAFIPTVLARMSIDPAVASSVFVTALTDLTGFMLLLGLASALML